MASQGTTPNRSTIVTLDAPIYGLQEPPLYLSYSGAEISRQTDTSQHVVKLDDGTWTLASYEHEQHVVHETAVADAARITPANSNAQVAPGLLEIPQQRWYSELTGVPQGTQRTSGDLLLLKQVQAGSSWHQELTADQAAFPSCDASNDVVPCDRMLVANGTDANHNPNQAFQVSFQTDIPATGAKQRWAKIYFTGIPGETQGDYNNSENGIGQYCLILYGSSRAELWEKMSSGVWGSLDVHGNRRPRTLFSLNGLKNPTSCDVFIHTDAVQDSAGNWKGYGMKFQFALQFNNGVQNKLIKTVVNIAQDLLSQYDSQWYIIPQYEVNQPTLAPLRLDMRRDTRALFKIQKQMFYAQGTLQTVNFSFAHPPFDTTQPIIFNVFGSFPTGTSITVDLYDATPGSTSLGTQLTAVSGTLVQNLFGWGQSYTPIQNDTQYYAIVTLNASTDQTKAPKISQIQTIRYATTKATTPTGTIAKIVEQVSITGQDSDPSHESLGLSLVDKDSSIDTLKGHSGSAIRVETQLDPSDATKTSTLFAGYVSQAKRHKKGGATKKDGFAFLGSDTVYPNSDWGRYSLRATGEWRRLMEAQAPHTIGLEADPGTVNDNNAVQGYKVTDHIVALLQACGYPDQMIDVADLSIRYLSDNGPLIVEPFTVLGPVIIQLVRDWLGGYLIFDPNASNGGGSSDKYGCWRLKIPPKPDSMGNYINVASFNSSPTNTSYYVPSISPAAYPDTTVGSQTLKNTFIRKGTLFSYIVEPEANVVYCTGVGVPPSTLSVQSGVSQNPQKLQQVAINYNSAVFSPSQGTSGNPPLPDTSASNIDYLGRVVPIYYADPSLTTPDAVNLVLRRIYDMACHGQKRVMFEAPVVLVTEAADTKQLRPRKLQYGDPILVDGVQFFVASCNIDYSFRKGGSRYMHAAYEVFSVPQLTTKSPAIGRA